MSEIKTKKVTELPVSTEISPDDLIMVHQDSGLNTIKYSDIKKNMESDIVDDTTSTDTDKPLSANQGKILADRLTSDEKEISDLKETKVDKEENKGLSTNDFTDEYKSQVDTNKNNITDIDAKKINISDIINNTASTDTDKPLSANQGKVLAERLTSDENDISNLQDIKVDKIEGKSLSTNDYTDDEKAQVATNKSDISTLQSSKVDKIEGKGLSTNDYSNEEKAQVATNKTDILSLQNVLTALGLSVDSDGYIVQEV